MQKLYDPVSGEEVELYGSKGESNEVYEPYVDAVIRNLAWYYKCSEKEAENMLINSDIDNPVTYNDEVFWVE